MLAYSISILFTLIYSGVLFFTGTTQIPIILLVYPLTYTILSATFYLPAFGGTEPGQVKNVELLKIQDAIIRWLPVLGTAICLVANRGLVGTWGLGLVFAIIPTIFFHQVTITWLPVFVAIAQIAAYFIPVLPITIAGSVFLPITIAGSVFIISSICTSMLGLWIYFISKIVIG